jgi:hypothetical protein
VLRRDAVVTEHKALLRTALVPTPHPVFAPPETHRVAVDGEVDVTDHRPLFHLGGAAAGRTSGVRDDLFDHELDVSTVSFVTQDADVLQPHEGLEDLSRVGSDEGASRFLAHTSSLKRLRRDLSDPRSGYSPLKSEEPFYLAESAADVRLTRMFAILVACTATPGGFAPPI